MLPKGARNALFHVGFNIARPEFEKFAYLYAYAPNMQLGLEAMASRGFSPATIVDVGAFEGNWSRMAKSIWPAAHIRMIEPNEKLAPLLEGIAAEIGGRLHCELLGAEEGQEVEFFVMESGSSVMEEQSDVPRTVEKRQLATLDSVLDDLDSIDLLKIDAQGFELQILQGAKRLIQTTKSVLLEISLIEINAGAPLLHEVVSFMNDLGFVAYDIMEIHRRPLDKALNQFDIIFIREDSPLRANKRHA